MEFGVFVMHVLTLSGTPYEVGVEHGRKLSELIEAYYSFNRILLRDIPDEVASKIVSQVQEAMEKFYPDALDEIRGIADGSGLEYENVLLMNFASEVKRSVQGGCTAFTAVGDSTINSKTIMAKTRDLRYQAYHPFQIAMKVCVPGKFDVFLAEAFAGRVVTGCGINEHGLGLILNIVNINDFDGSIGIQRSFLARFILENCENVKEAVKQFSTHELAYCGANYLICDVDGDCALIEKSHSHQVVKGPEGGIITVTNHFTDPAMLKFQGRLGRSSPLRLNQITALLNANVGDIDVELAKGFLKSHEPSAICRHDAIGVNTVSAYVVDADLRIIHIADGHPCKSPFKAYSLKEI